jgi:hypothetical protein
LRCYTKDQLALAAIKAEADEANKSKADGDTVQDEDDEDADDNRRVTRSARKIMGERKKKTASAVAAMAASSKGAAASGASAFLPTLPPAEGSFFLGHEFNPRLFVDTWMFDVKMFLYLVGACVMQWLLLAALAVEAEHNNGICAAASAAAASTAGAAGAVGGLSGLGVMAVSAVSTMLESCSLAMLTYVGLLTYFLCEYMYWEVSFPP